MVVRVAVIGAGAAGLASARRLRENKLFLPTVFEQTDTIGGTWVYDERIGTDEYGLPIHTSMYKNLRTNLPKEVMGYPGFPITKPENKSYIPAADILAFLKSFTEAFHLYDIIKLRHVVRKINRKADGSGWNLEVENLRLGTRDIVGFDAVMICNGHYEVPNIPVIPGQDIFTGLQIHSHDYRKPEFFRDMTVVVIGAGPSGLDIGLDITSVAKHVYLSHHSSDKIDTCFPKNFSFKPDVKKLHPNEVEFVDGSKLKADCVLYCTGFLYSFPFLTKECGIKVENNRVHPLYKHLIAIESPTLCFIGLPFYVCAFSMFDLQARFFIASLTEKFKLPSKEEMLQDENEELIKRQKKGFGSRDFHKMGPLQIEYYEDLAKTAEIQGLAPVLTKLHNESSRRFLEDLINFREDNYIILDDENFLEVKRESNFTKH